jgi:WD40 repeat protein
VGSVCVSQKVSTYQSKIAFMISGAGDKILKRWPLPVHSFVPSVVLGKEVNEVLHLAVSHNVRAHDKDINTLAVSPNDAMAASGTLPLPTQPSTSDTTCLKLVTRCNELYSSYATPIELSITRMHYTAIPPSLKFICNALKVIAHSHIHYLRIYVPGSQDKTIRLWRTSDLAPIASLSGHKRGIWKVAFSPVDRCLASCSGDRTIRLWSVVDYTCLRVFEGHTASVLTVKFANKGMQLLSGAADGLIRLWTIRSGECENTFDLHSDRVWAIAVGNNAAPG